MSFLKEFKTFAMRGNVVDMAVGIIIGGAFGKIVSSLVSDIIMPLDFLIIAFSIFLFVKLINSMKRKEETKPTPPPAPSKEEQLLTEIRDLLKGKNS